MVGIATRDIDYRFNETTMSGYFAVPSDAAQPLPGLLIVHDAWGLTDEVKSLAEKFASLGFAVFCADAWGDRFCPSSEDEIGSSIGAMVHNRAEWQGRISAAFDVLESQPESNAEAIGGLGYCFGGASILEHLRIGGRIHSAVSIHGGLDLLDSGWNASSYEAAVLLCTGSDDPMATESQRATLQQEMSTAGITWEVDLYSHTVHAFTSPKSAHSPRKDLFDYNPLSSQRAWDRTVNFLHETLNPSPA